METSPEPIYEPKWFVVKLVDKFGQESMRFFECESYEDILVNYPDPQTHQLIIQEVKLVGERISFQATNEWKHKEIPVHISSRLWYPK